VGSLFPSCAPCRTLSLSAGGVGRSRSFFFFPPYIASRPSQALGKTDVLRIALPFFFFFFFFSFPPDPPPVPRWRSKIYGAGQQRDVFFFFLFFPPLRATSPFLRPASGDENGKKSRKRSPFFFLSFEAVPVSPQSRLNFPSRLEIRRRASFSFIVLFFLSS